MSLQIDNSCTAMRKYACTYIDFMYTSKTMNQNIHLSKTLLNHEKSNSKKNKARFKDSF